MTQRKKTPPQALKLWIKALRSGKYEQCRGFLSKDDAYCCLGVGCEVFLHNENSRLKVTNLNDHKEYGGREGDLPPMVGRWLGIDKITPLKYEDLFAEDPNDVSIEEILIKMNDNFRRPFSVIADYLESQILPIVTANHKLSQARKK